MSGKMSTGFMRTGRIKGAVLRVVSAQFKEMLPHITERANCHIS